MVDPLHEPEPRICKHPDDAPPGPRVAIAHDWLCGYRGGEAVLERIAILADAHGRLDRLYTMFDDGASLAPAIDATPRTVSPLGAFPNAMRRWLLPAYPLAVCSLSRRLRARHRHTPIDLLISTSSAAIKGLKPPRGVPHLCYCHAPARYIWSVRDEYTAGRRFADRARRLGLRGVALPFKAWDRATAANVTAFLANSSHTAAEIKRCFAREAEVVFPPVRTVFFTPDPSVTREDFWLFAGALEPYKRADLAAEAALMAGARLVVVGNGSMREALRHRYERSEILFPGRVTDAELRSLYRRARLLIFPQIEDFGITAVEAMACGCPVVARRAGGAIDTVTDGVTGAFFDAAEPAEIVRAVARCPADTAACRANAERFSEEAFDDAMLARIRRALSPRDDHARPTGA